MPTTSDRRNLRDDGITADEGEGTWSDWTDSDPIRLQNLFSGAVHRLRLCYEDRPIDETNSIDGTETAFQRYAAHVKKVQRGQEGWSGYDSYRSDFEGKESAADTILEDFLETCKKPRKVKNEIVSTCSGTNRNDSDQTPQCGQDVATSPNT